MKKSKLKKKLKRLKQKVDLLMQILENHAAALRSTTIISTRDTIRDWELTLGDGHI